MDTTARYKRRVLATMNKLSSRTVRPETPLIDLIEEAGTLSYRAVTTTGRKKDEPFGLLFDLLTLSHMYASRQAAYRRRAV